MWEKKCFDIQTKFGIESNFQWRKIPNSLLLDSTLWNHLLLEYLNLALKMQIRWKMRYKCLLSATTRFRLHHHPPKRDVQEWSHEHLHRSHICLQRPPVGKHGKGWTAIQGCVTKVEGSKLASDKEPGCQHLLSGPTLQPSANVPNSGTSNWRSAHFRSRVLLTFEWINEMCFFQDSWLFFLYCTLKRSPLPLFLYLDKRESHWAMSKVENKSYNPAK